MKQKLYMITTRDKYELPIIKGLCDDAYCPECGYGFWYPGETDMPRCPECGTFVDWTQWHKMNDEEGENV